MIRFLFAAALLGCAALLASPARAITDYTDTWWTPSEPGWGINLTHQANAVFGTFYVYGQDGKSIWFTAQMTRDGTGERFTGSLYRINGTWYGAPTWNGYQIAPAGTATFTATSSTSGTLVYSVDSVNVTKTIERITLAPLSVAGVYIGGLSGRRNGCQASSVPIVDAVQFDVLHSTLTNDLRIDQLSTKPLTLGQLVCRMEGRTVQTGKVLTVESATYSCVDGWSSPARIFNLRPTPAGFEGQWFSDGGNGCSESGQFSGVTQFP
jgi:hypothetical protein